MSTCPPAGTDSVLVRNAAGQSVTISSIVSSDTSSFAVDSATPFTLLAGDSARVRIVFHPRVLGQREARISLTNNGPSSPDTLHVAGLGGVPLIAISPSGLSIGAIPLASVATR
jgi:hypothetical protein